MAYQKNTYEDETYPVVTFIDIETVAGCRIRKDHPVDMPPRIYEAYLKRYRKGIDEISNDQKVSHAEALDLHYRKNAGLTAEFGQVICVSIGKLVVKEGAESKFYIKSIAGRHEKELLIEVGKALQKSQSVRLCAHNGMEFDFPYLERRYMVNSLHIPHLLKTFGKKTWELPMEDTMKIWGGAAWNYKVSLDLLAELFDIPSPKQEMTGADVADIYFSMFDGVAKEDLPFDKEDEVLGKISKYCNGDIFVLANVYCRMRGFELIKPEQIIYT